MAKKSEEEAQRIRGETLKRARSKSHDPRQALDKKGDRRARTSKRTIPKGRLRTGKAGR